MNSNSARRISIPSSQFRGIQPLLSRNAFIGLADSALNLSGQFGSPGSDQSAAHITARHAARGSLAYQNMKR
ncbi:MAG: hypothetical protein QY305_14855 [Candidatus Brocadiaceae baterium WH-1]|nr:MAG: hypothetical protein QY305_14855 [Candidatus Jettenia sp. AMX2]